MTREEAAKIMELSPKTGLPKANAAYAAKLRALTTRSQYATDPADRDVAARSVGLLREAYQVLTGSPPPAHVQPDRQTPASPATPRVSLSTDTKPAAPPRPAPLPRRSILDNQPAAGARPAPLPSTRPAPRKRTPAGRAPIWTARSPEVLWAWGILSAIIVLAISLVYQAAR